MVKGGQKGSKVAFLIKNILKITLQILCDK